MTSAYLTPSRSWKYVADKILKINEKKKWTDPPPTDPTKRAAQDEEIFQTARLIKYAESLFYDFLYWPFYIAAVTLWVSSWVIMFQASLVYLRAMPGTWMHSMYGWFVHCSTVANPVKTAYQRQKRDRGTERRRQPRQCRVQCSIPSTYQFYSVAVCFFDLYPQWHATTSQADEKWTQDFFNSKMGGKPLDKIDVQDFALAFGGAIRATLATPPKDRTIGR